jgi:oligoendopeptidase F
MNSIATIQKTPRIYIPQDFTISTWDNLKPYFEELCSRNITSKTELETWLQNISELQAVISEDACWRQIRMTCDTENKTLEEAFTFFCTEIEPAMKPYFHQLNEKLIACEFVKELDKETYFVYLRSVESALKLYNEKNNSIQADINILAQQYGAITGKMSITHDGVEYTMQQAVKFLMQPDRELRETIYKKITERRKQDEDELNKMFDTLTAKRHEIAINSGFENYRDYKFEELGRFDYTVEDCTQFHEAVKKHILPIVEKIYDYKRKKLLLDVLKPYDLEAEPAGVKPLEPFKNGEDLLQKSVETFNKLRPDYGACLQRMHDIKQLDLDSRKGKAPGGYNCPLAETGIPFIFMNAASTADDVVTMMHEGGHALHSFYSHNLPLSAFKEYPMEMAELASMSMELFSMEHWNTFYTNEDELQRAKAEELERALTIFPWIATIDKFQHWIYTNPTHTHKERTENWLRIYNEFAPKNIDWTGFEDYKAMLWQKQLHLFEVPFYYIEYGIAQLGAVAMWQQYKQNKEQALDNYERALSKGYTQPLKELYKTAGIEFDFSPDRIKVLSEFLEVEMNKVFV